MGFSYPHLPWCWRGSRRSRAPQRWGGWRPVVGLKIWWITSMSLKWPQLYHFWRFLDICWYHHFIHCHGWNSAAQGTQGASAYHRCGRWWASGSTSFGSRACPTLDFVWFWPQWYDLHPDAGTKGGYYVWPIFIVISILQMMCAAILQEERPDMSWLSNSQNGRFWHVPILLLMQT